MLKHLYLILIATFIFGFLTGVIVYFQNNTGEEGDGGLETNTKGFTIVAYMYGGCEMGGGCPSYRIANDGSYTYIVRDREAGETRHDDSLSRKLHDLLRAQVQGTDYERIFDTESSGTCPVVFDGAAYRYDIVYEGERYEFDSCEEDLGDEALFETLENYFTVFNVTYSTVRE